MKHNLKVILCTFLISGLMTGTSITAFADTSTTNADTVPSGKKINFMAPGQGGGRGGSARGNNLMNEELINTLTDNDIISDETGAAIIKYLENKNAERKAEMEKMKSLTKEEREAQFAGTKESKPEKKAGILDELVAEEIVTQAESEAISSYLKKQSESKQAEEQEKRLSDYEDKLDSLVESDTIEGSQADAILAFLKDENQEREAQMEKIESMTEEEREAQMEKFNSMTEERKAQMEKMKNMTEEERKAQMEKMKSMTEEERKAAAQSGKNTMVQKKSSILAELVENGTLTQVQADAVIKALYGNLQGRAKPGAPGQGLRGQESQ